MGHHIILTVGNDLCVVPRFIGAHPERHTGRSLHSGGYGQLQYKIICDTMEESLLRIENRVKRGGHNINTDPVTNRFRKRFEDLLAVLPYCNKATFYDNDNGFVTVAKYKNGELRTVGQVRPKWLTELIEKMN